MDKNKPYKELCQLIAKRSICQVQVGALIYDSKGCIISWGWNHVGNGFGLCAERHAISRANKSRLVGSTILVHAYRRGRSVNSFPCVRCYQKIKKSKIKFVECNDSNKNWGVYKI